MMQIQKFVFFLLLLCNASALKGSRMQSRQLDDTEAQKTQKAQKETPSDKKAEPKVKDEKHVDKKEDKKDKRKEPKGRKCKKDKKQKDKDDEESSIEENTMLDEEEVEEEEVAPFVCLEVNMNTNCAALLTGETPVVPDSADGIAGGTLQIELTSKNGDDAIEQLNSALDKVALMASGCNVTEFERMLNDANNTEVDTVGDISVDLNGLTVGDLALSSSNCSTKAMEENCTVFETPFTIYFSGNATTDHLNSMGYSLSDTVIDEAKKGEYDEIAEIHYVSASIDNIRYEGDLVESESSTRGVGGIIGIAVAALALVAAGVAGVLFYKKRQVATVNPTPVK